MVKDRVVPSIICDCGNINEMDNVSCPKCGRKPAVGRSILFCPGCGATREIFMNSQNMPEHPPSCHNCGYNFNK